MIACRQVEPDDGPMVNHADRVRNLVEVDDDEGSLRLFRVSLQRGSLRGKVQHASRFVLEGRRAWSLACRTTRD